MNCSENVPDCDESHINIGGYCHPIKYDDWSCGIE